ncbi:MAG: hypothetical protein ACKPB4_17880 [Sphaerospermopsis kisseleviana]
MEDPVRNRGTRRRRKRVRSFDHDSLHKWAKDDVPEGDPRDERNLGLVVAVAIGLILILLFSYIAGQMKYEAPF